MSKYTYSKILSKAKTVQTNTKKSYKTGTSSWWSYYFSKVILNGKKEYTVIKIGDASKPTGNSISRQIPKANYKDMCKRLVSYVDKNKKMPNYITYGSYKVTPRLFTEILSRIVIYYDKNKKLPSYVNANSKVFTKPVESKNEVYKYFVKQFGSVSTIDGALSKINGRGYSYYYDDKYSNKTSIDRMKKGLGVNCTDSCQVFYNIVSALIEKGKYKKVECLHVMCNSGGHVKLRITLNDGTKIIRDPACALSDNGLGYKCNWCTNTPIAVNPSWFLENLKR